MGNKTEPAFSVGELAEKSGVTVRTLQYYDRMDLLRARLSEGGRRTYTLDDALRLQQILFLKSCGFQLGEIKNALRGRQSAADLAQMFRQQRDILIEQLANGRKMVDMLDKVLDELSAGGEITMERLTAMMELTRQGNPYRFILRYFDDENLKSVARRFSKRFSTESDAEPYMNEFNALFGELGALYHSGADPAAPEAQAFAARWWGMVSDFTGGDSELLRVLLSVGTDIDNWPEESRELRESIEHFLKDALGIYFEKSGIQLPPAEEDHHG